MPSPASDPRLDLWSEQVGELALEASRELAAIGVRREDKGSIVALHWRGAQNQEAARLGLIAVADKAVAQGLAIHWGRKVLELRPPVPFDKGRAIERLIQSKVDQGYAFDLAIFAGDDLTDLDAFAAVRRMSDAETVGSGVCIAVTSSEVPQALVAASDLQVDSPEAMSQLLDRLLAELLQ
jgi:trehalose 6-phosphate phosphatase